jgi:hypothetical protein
MDQRVGFRVPLAIVRVESAGALLDAEAGGLGGLLDFFHQLHRDLGGQSAKQRAESLDRARRIAGAHGDEPFECVGLVCRGVCKRRVALEHERQPRAVDAERRITAEMRGHDQRKGPEWKLPCERIPGVEPSPDVGVGTVRELA